MSQHRVGNFIIGAEIGRGSFANVYRGNDLKTGQSVAVKSVFRSRLKNQKLIDNLEIEIKILKNMTHPHIVALLDCVKTDQYFHLFMEYCSLGDLSYFIKKRDQLVHSHPIIRSILLRYPSPEGSNGLNKTIVVNFIKQLASALEFLRSQNLVHRDIKPQNLLLAPPCHGKQEFIDIGYAGYWELPVLKIADFGFARFLPSTSMAETLCGSPLYMAPEILRYEKYNAKADLWSVGAVIYEMTVGKPPFRAANHVELLRKIEKAKDEISFPQNIPIDESIIRLICSLLKANPTERMGFNEFFEDSLVVNDVVDVSDEPLNCSVEDEQLFVSEYIHLNSNSNSNSTISNINKKNNLTSVINSKVNIPERVEEEDGELASSDNRQSISNSRSESPPIAKTKTKTKTNIAEAILSKISSDGTDTVYECAPGKVEELLNAHKQQKNLTATTKGNSETNSNLNAMTATAINTTSSKNKNTELPIVNYEREYVVVDKGTVEINSLADDISRAGKTISISPRAYNFSNGLTRGYSLSRRKSSAGSGNSSNSPGNALRDMLDYTHEKLFGQVTSTSNNLVNINNIGNSNSGDGNINVSIISGNNSIRDKRIDTVRQFSPSFSDDKKSNDVISQLEILATMAHSVLLLAEIKFNQLIPLPPSLQKISDPFSISTLESLGLNERLHPEQVRILSKEGAALYVKVLDILAEAMKLAGDWWKKNSMKADVNSSELNELVQWIRSRFNESFEKAEFFRLRLSEIEGESYQNNEENGKAEKLIFDRALEMSKKAATLELKGEDLISCERSYSTSIWMLEAILHGKGLEEKDRKTVQTFVDSIGNRLLVLRSKLATKSKTVESI